LSLFSCKTCFQTLRLAETLRIQLQDTLEARQTAERVWAEERRDLLNRIQSLLQPASLREFRRESPSKEQEPHLQPPVRINHPGYRPSTRPPVDMARLEALRDSKKIASQRDEAGKDLNAALEKAVLATNTTES
jgi:hypothetical protein